MNRVHLSALLFAAGTTGCGLDYDLHAVESLVISAIDGAEDYLTSDPTAISGELFRDCDTAAVYADLFDVYDEDGDGALDRGEADAAVAEVAAGASQEALLALVKLVYDLDDDGSFSQSELDTLFADFSERCDALQAELVTELGASGSGAGGEASGGRAGAGDLHAPRDPERGEMDACRRSCSGAATGESAGVGPVLAEFDGDGSGDLDDGELEDARGTLRGRLRRGEDPHPRCGG